MENKIFEGVKRERHPYSNFDLSFEHKTSFNIGELIPVFHQDVLPGDIFSVNADVLIRMAPMLAPVMHRVNVFIHYFFVPNRIIWTDWEDFITGGDDGTASPTFPKFQGDTAGQFIKGSIHDYLGIPFIGDAVVPTTDYDFITHMSSRGYHAIWNDYYRDQQLQTEIDVTTPSSWIHNIRLRNWEKDYFTSCLPAAQKGSEITAALTLSENITYSTQATTVGTATSTGLYTNASKQIRDDLDTLAVGIDNISNLGLSGTVSINDLRLASEIQRFWERRNTGGSRYTEYILSEFGVRSSDSRLQRPEYLGGGRAPVVISETLSTAAESTGVPQGNMAGHGISAGDGFSFKYRAEEYGQIYGILSVMPRTAYQEGVNKKFFKDDRFDYGLPAFANIGEQVVQNRELYFDATTGADNPTGTFGYQMKYAEYKYNPSIVSGDFRDDLNYWTWSRIFAAEPSLNEDFIQCDFEDESLSRIFSSEEAATHKLWCQCYFDVKAKRALPYFPDYTLQ
jgi:hypothetical protein